MCPFTWSTKTAVQRLHQNCRGYVVQYKMTSISDFIQIWQIKLPEIAQTCSPNRWTRFGVREANVHSDSTRQLRMVRSRSYRRWTHLRVIRTRTHLDELGVAFAKRNLTWSSKIRDWRRRKREGLPRPLGAAPRSHESQVKQNCRGVRKHVI